MRASRDVAGKDKWRVCVCEREREREREGKEREEKEKKNKKGTLDAFRQRKDNLFAMPLFFLLFIVFIFYIFERDL